jgi:hypothetical protein
MIQLSFGRVVSLLFAIGCATAISVHEHAFTAEIFAGCLCLLVPLALIWFPEVIGSATGYCLGGLMRVDTPTPAIFISSVGWILLVAFPAVLYAYLSS